MSYKAKSTPGKGVQQERWLARLNKRMGYADNRVTRLVERLRTQEISVELMRQSLTSLSNLINPMSEGPTGVGDTEARESAQESVGPSDIGSGSTIKKTESQETRVKLNKTLGELIRRTD